MVYNIPITDGEVIFAPHFFSEAESERLLNELHTSIQWRQDDIVLFGKKMKQPRLTAWYGDHGKQYTYSQLTMQPEVWTTPLLQIKERIELESKASFNSVLLNLYRNGQDSMGWHSDDEPELGKNPTIASISFGASRRFHLKHKHNKEIKRVRLDLNAGSLLIMKGELQHYWQHCISKTKREIGMRINLTFRWII